VHPHPDCRDAQIETLRDDAVGHAFDLAREHDLAVERRQRGERGAEQVEVLVARLFVSRSGRALGERPFRSAPPDDVDRASDRDRADPGAEARLWTIPIQGAERLEERFLRGVLGEPRVAGDAARRGQRRRRGSADEGRDRLLIPLARADDELILFGLRGRGRGRRRWRDDQTRSQSSPFRNAPRAWRSSSPL